MAPVYRQRRVDETLVDRRGAQMDGFGRGRSAMTYDGL